MNPAGGFCDGPAKPAGKGYIPFFNSATNATLTTGTPITLNNIHWLVPAANTGFGTLGSKHVAVPGRQDWTFGLQRTIDLHSERHQLVVRTEMLNPFNHPNSGNPLSPNLSGVSFFRDPTQTADKVPAVNFLNTDATVTGARIIRFWLKYQF